DARHIRKLHEAIGSEHGVRWRAAEEAKATCRTRNFEGQEPLVASIDVELGLQLYVRALLTGSTQIIKHKHIGIVYAARLLKTAIRFPEHPGEAINGLADDARI